MGKSLWVLVDRYDPVIRLLGLRRGILEEYVDPWDLMWAYDLVLADVVRLREEAEAAALRLEGPRAP